MNKTILKTKNTSGKIRLDIMRRLKNGEITMKEGQSELKLAKNKFRPLPTRELRCD